MDSTAKKFWSSARARSGVAAARFLAARGAVVALNDRKAFIDWPNEALRLKAEGVVGLLAGDVPSWLLDQIELVVMSPGVPTKSIPVRYAERAGAEVIGEVELAWRFLRGRVVGITGTNGKTTTTTLIGELVEGRGTARAGRRQHRDAARLARRVVARGRLDGRRAFELPARNHQGVPARRSRSC